MVGDDDDDDKLLNMHVFVHREIRRRKE